MDETKTSIEDVLAQEADRAAQAARIATEFAQSCLEMWPTVAPDDFMESDPLPFLLRASLTRQMTCLGIAVHISSGWHAHLLGGFVRKAFEELTWIKYLTRLEVSTRRDLAISLGVRELGTLVESQQKKHKKRGMRERGFEAQFVRSVVDLGSQQRQSIQQIAEKLEWDKDQSTGLYMYPSIGGMANEVGLATMYSELYDASSRSVHFSVSDCMRRASITPQGDLRFDFSTAVVEQNIYVIDRCIHLMNLLIVHAHQEIEGHHLEEREIPVNDDMAFYRPDVAAPIHITDFMTQEDDTE